MSRYVSTGTAAREIGVSTSSLNRWVVAGLVKPAMRTPGGQYRWDLDDLRRQLGLPSTAQHDESTITPD